MRTKDLAKIELIYSASLKLIRREGIAGLTMSNLAREANLATGTLYIYFKNKEELLHNLYTKLNIESSKRFMHGYDLADPFRIGFKKVWINYLKHRIENYEESVFLEQYYRSQYITKKQRLMAESMKHPVHVMLQRGKKEMLVKSDVDDEMLFLALLGFIRELADEHVSGVYKLNKEKIEKAFQLSWDTIKT